MGNQQHMSEMQLLFNSQKHAYATKKQNKLLSNSIDQIHVKEGNTNKIMWQQQLDYFKSRNTTINTIQTNMVQAITNLAQVLGMTFTNKNNLNNGGNLVQHNGSNQLIDVDEIVHKKDKNVNDEK